MKKTILPLVLLLCALLWPVVLPAQMNNRKLEKILSELGREVKGETGSWHLDYKDYFLFVITDEANNRMRIFTPIVEEKEIDAQEMHKMLVANFHTALDAKYSIYEGFVISTYTHPLRELTEAQLKDAMLQVVNLARTFGTTYSSSELFFNLPGKEEETEEQPKEVKPLQGKRS